MSHKATILGFAAAGCLTLTPAYAAPQAHGHASAPPAGKPVVHSGTTTTTNSAVTSPKLNPIAQKLTVHPQLLSRVTALLPAGMTLSEAAAGFKNQGQFIAALHASKNLNIPFAQLQTEMTGKDHVKLGVAIHELKPGSDAKAQAKLAETQAEQDLKASKTPKPHGGDKDGDDK